VLAKLKKYLHTKSQSIPVIINDQITCGLFEHTLNYNI